MSGDLAGSILVDLDDLQLGLARLALAWATEPAIARARLDFGCVAFERIHTLQRHQIFW